MPKYKPLISDRAIQRVYLRMLQAHALDQRLAPLSIPGVKTGESAEAMLASLLDDLQATDLLIARKEEPLAQLLRGREVASILGDLLASDARSSRALFAPSDSGIASFKGTAAEMATYAAGAARALQNEAAGKRGKQVVTMALLGEVKDPRVLDSALRACGQGHLPLILVCRTVGKRNLQVNSSLLHGIPHMPVDARDAVAVYRVAQEALLRVRTGLGSVLVECRFLPGNPLKTMQAHLSRKGLLDEAAVETTKQLFTATLNTAFSPWKRRPVQRKSASATKRIK